MSKPKPKKLTDTLFQQTLAGAPPHPPKLVNHFVVCLDSSSSMSSLMNAAIKSFNSTAASIREGAKSSDQEATTTLITFADRPQVKISCAPVDSLIDLDHTTYRPYGNTALLDAVMEGTKLLKMRSDVKDENVSYMFVIITDGEENRSSTPPGVFAKELFDLQATDRWSFAFLVPPGAKAGLCRRYNVPTGNVQEWETTAKGMEYATQSMDAGIQSYYGTRSLGLRSTQGFFNTDLTGLSTKDVRNQLTNINHLVKQGEVNKTVQIRDFVEKDLKVNPYTLGRAFYQLNKDEKVQHHKKVMIRERTTGNVYAGDEARKLLGLPDKVDVKVRPGDHASWDIFIQSTSTNRKLVPGTKLLYLL